MSKKLTRQQILDAFGITEDDLAALKAFEDANGYTAAKERAAAEYAYFRYALGPATLARFESEFGGEQ